MSYRVVLIVFATALLRAQEGEADRAVLPAPATPVYQAPTASERFHDFANDTFGLFAIPRVAFGAGIEHLENTPPEWGQGAKGFGLRNADVFGRLLVQNTIVYGSAIMLHEDTRYYRCECTGTWRRVGHAAKSVFTARTPHGGTTFAFARMLGIYGSGMIETLWYPARYSPVKDGLRNAEWTFPGELGMNIANEFWPDIRRKVFHKR